MARKPATAHEPPVTVLERRDRYTEQGKATDAFGRVIVVQRLRPSQQSKIEGMTLDLPGSVEVHDEAGRPGYVPRATRHFIAAAVREIYDADGTHKIYPFPQNRGELDAVFDFLDDEGLDAASEALFALLMRARSAAETKEEAKN
jgi:hypothetical protein